MYTFKDKGHQHLFNGKRMTGITTILGVIAKPQLINWAAGQAVEYVSKEWKPDFAYRKEVIEQVLSDAKKAHTKKKEAAADIGTLVHSACEGWIKEKKEPELDEQGMKMFNNFKKWAEDNKVKFLESEKHLYSEKMFLAGIVDGVVEIDGQTWIMDIKTSSGIYSDAFFQMAGYHILWEEMMLPNKITGYIVVNLQKSGEFLEKRMVSIDDSKKAFLAAYDIYRIQQKINNQIL